MEAKEVVLGFDGALRIGGRISVRKMGELIILILLKAHCSPFTIRLGEINMYHSIIGGTE